MRYSSATTSTLTISITLAKPANGRAAFTTLAGARRLGAPAEGLAPWQSVKISKPGGAKLQITGPPARDGPAGIEFCLAEPQLKRAGSALSTAICFNSAHHLSKREADRTQ
jgi:hypothetical protein